MSKTPSCELGSKDAVFSMVWACDKSVFENHSLFTGGPQCCDGIDASGKHDGADYFAIRNEVLIFWRAKQIYEV